MAGTMDISDNRKPDSDPKTQHPKMDFEEKRRHRVLSDAVSVRTWSFKKVILSVVTSPTHRSALSAGRRAPPCMQSVGAKGGSGNGRIVAE